MEEREDVIIGREEVKRRVDEMYNEVERAFDRITGIANKTPVFTSRTVNSLINISNNNSNSNNNNNNSNSNSNNNNNNNNAIIAATSCYFKMETFQRIGAFKFRGALNHVCQLSEEEKKRGVVTHSSGNHAQALALASKEKGVKAVIVMPRTSPLVKVNATRGYGAEVVLCEPTLQARESTTQAIIDKQGCVLVHPYDNWKVIFGAATAAYEFLREVPDLDVIICPVGGGGLLSGTAITAKGYSSRNNRAIKVIGAEPEGASDAFKSFYGGKWVPIEHPNTIADGLLTSLGKRNYEIITALVDEIVLASDEEIKQAMNIMFTRMKCVVEPSGCIPLAVALKLGKTGALKGKKVGLIITGGNVDLSFIAKL